MIGSAAPFEQLPDPGYDPLVLTIEHVVKAPVATLDGRHQCPSDPTHWKILYHRHIRNTGACRRIERHEIAGTFKDARQELGYRLDGTPRDAAKHEFWLRSGQERSGKLAGSISQNALHDAPAER